MKHPLDFLNPHEDEKESTCYYCGIDCDGDFCSKDCEKADYKENCLD